MSVLEEELAANPNDASCVIARRILTTDPMALVGVVAGVIDDYRRHRVHAIEGESLAAFVKRHHTGRPIQARTGHEIERLRSALRAEFALYDRSSVSWGRATVLQHRLRIGLLAKNMAGIRETIVRHEQAIRKIEAAGVTCLDELLDVAAA